jgi:hypothetical protein
MVNSTQPMARRLKALIRKAEPYTPSELKNESLQSSLLACLLPSVTRKREYDDIFGSHETAAAWAQQRGLNDENTKLLLLMQVWYNVIRCCIVDRPQPLR